MRIIYLALGVALVACTAEQTKLTDDFGFDGTCVNCHAGLSALHVHSNYKLRCVDCHGGNDQVTVDAQAFNDPKKFQDPTLLAKVHVVPKKGLSRFFFANGVDDNGDGQVDEPAVINPPGCAAGCTVNPGENYEPQLHGEGPGEFVDDELQRDLNYTRFLNPGDLRVATVGCGASNRAAGGAGGNGSGCHQETIEVVRRSIMVNQPAVINGAYYGNESWRATFFNARGATKDPRAGAFSYGLDYAGVDKCITVADATDTTGRAQPKFDSTCLEARASSQDPAVAAGAPGNVGLPAFEMAQGTITPVDGTTPGQTIDELGAGDTRYPWGGTIIADTDQERAKLAPVPNEDLAGNPGIPDPVDNILRTFRAYYPLNYPGSVVNQNFTFGTSIVPEINRFKTNNPFGRGHSSGCTACHAEYDYDGSRQPTQVLQDDGTIVSVVDPTTKHREFNPDTDDRGIINGTEQLIGRVVNAQQQSDAAAARGNNCGPGRACQQKTYSANHTLTTAVTTKQCGLCHGFVTRINYAYQGMAEEEQRDQLARRKEIDFMTPAGTQVRIIDSWVREDNLVIIDPPGLDIIKKAKQRDADLAAKGFVPGNGGCAQEVFSEDCNNNGELDHNLVLTHVNEDGSTSTITIDEDLDNDGKLTLIDRLPREESIDGRQMKYIYGGRNGSTRLMDIHFERGMHCIDCHFLQDVHGDGHVYSTNWDQIEIECEDCHGAKDRATLKTSGPNGGNDLTTTRDPNLLPYFENRNGQIIQHSRVTPGLSWVIPQTPDQGGPGTLAGEAHSDKHIAAPGSGSTFAGAQGSSALTDAKLECATCHSSWIHNCMGCHVDLNVGDPQRITVDAAGNATKTARENEVWLSNANNGGHINFQLLGLLRAPFVLGVSSTSEQGRLGTFRSSMQAHVSVTDATGNQIIDNATFTTFQAIDGNSGRMNVATSGVAMNQTMAHTVRPQESRGCETCHPLVDKDSKVRNEHILAETMGLGAGVFPFVGDWGMLVGTGGIELYDYKQEHEIATNILAKVNRFPGMIVNPTDRQNGNVEPIIDGTNGIPATSIANDAVFIRNFNPTPALGSTTPPTLRDLGAIAMDTSAGAGTSGALLITDLTGRGNPTNARQSVGTATRNFVVTLPRAPHAVAHLAPDVSDPFVYAAVGTSGLSVVRIDNAPSAAPSATLLSTVPLPGGRTAIEVKLAGDVAYVGTQEGTIEVMSLANPGAPVSVGSANIGSPVNGIAIAGFMLFAATNNGLAVLALDDPSHPALVIGTTSPIIVPGIVAKNLFVSAGHVYLAAGTSGVFDIDVRTVAAPGIAVPISSNIAPGQPINASDVIVSKLPGQTWLLVADATGDMWGLKLDNRIAKQEKCFPDPLTAGCLLDMDFVDATVSGRDPSFDPVTNTFDAADASGVPFFRQTHTIVTAGKRLARPGNWEQIGTLTGRRLRDSFMDGSGVLSLPVMTDMRSVLICESSATSREPGNLGALGYADDAFFSTGTCQPLGDANSKRKSFRAPNRSVCPTAPGSTKATCLVGEQLGLEIAKSTTRQQK